MKKTVCAAMGALVLSASPALAGTQYDLRVDGLTCPFCAATSEKALKRLDGVTSVKTNLEAGVISVCAGPDTRLSDAKLKSLFLSKGFTYRGMSRKGQC